MKIVILDGQTKKENKKWTQYVSSVAANLKKHNHEVNHFVLKDLKINHCTGCFNCWMKTPGICVFDDDSREINRAVIQADFVLWASPLLMGFPSHYLKDKMDRSIPLIHPYFEVVNGEAHHLSRYPKYPLNGLLLQGDKDEPEDDLRLVSQIFSRTMLNLKSRLTFSATTNTPVVDLVSKIENTHNLTYQKQPRFIVKELACVNSPKKLLVVNGSPRGPRGNTPVMLKKCMDGFLSSEGTQAEMLHLVQVKDKEKAVAAYRDADCVLLGFPLYTDCMPGIVKEFMESLGKVKNHKDNPAMGFLVQSGFPEAAHSRHVEQYLISFAEKMHSPYLGTLVRGGCEGVRLMPESMHRKMFSTLSKLGVELAQQGGFNQKTIRSLVSVEKYSPIFLPLFKLAIKMPFMQMYWNNQLKKNDAFDKRFDQPYLPSG